MSLNQMFGFRAFRIYISCLYPDENVFQSKEATTSVGMTIWWSGEWCERA